MKSSKALQIRVLSLVAIIVSCYLVNMELVTGNFCPRLFSFPACYLVLIAYILVLLSTFIERSSLNKSFFYIGTLSLLAMAIWFSYNQIAGLQDCPVLLGIPLCYASLIVAVLLIILGLNK